MPFGRRRPLLRGAAVGGAAYAVGRHTARRSAAEEQQENEQNDRPDTTEGQQAYAAPAPSMSDELERLAALHENGTLSDDEFTAAKAKLLNG